MESGLQLHAFNQLNRIHHEAELKDVPKHRQRKPDGLEALSAARTGHSERRSVQTRFLDDGNAARARVGISDYSKREDESFEQFLDPQELEEWKQYQKALEQRSTQALAGQLQKWTGSGPPPDIAIPGPAAHDPVQSAIDSLTRSKSFTSKLASTTSEAPKVVKSKVAVDVALVKSSSGTRASGDLDLDSITSPSSARASPRLGRRSMSGVKGKEEGQALGYASPLGIRPSISNVFVVSHSNSQETGTADLPSSSHLAGIASSSAASLKAALLGEGGVQRIGSQTQLPGRASSSNLILDGHIELLSTGDVDLLASAGPSSHSRLGPKFGRRADTQEIATVGGDDSPMHSRRSMNGPTLFAGRVSLSGAVTSAGAVNAISLPNSAASAGAGGRALQSMPSVTGGSSGKAVAQGIEQQALEARVRFAAALGAGGSSSKGAERDSLTEFSRTRSFTSGTLGSARSSATHVTVGSGGGAALSHNYLKTVVHQAAVQHHGIAPITSKSATHETVQMPFRSNH